MIKFFEKHSKISWFVVIIITIGIFYMSSLTFSPGPPGTNIKAILYHILTFFFLAFFLLPAIVKGDNKKIMILAIILAFLYGISDEIHQLFVPGRCFAFSDMMLDLFGILIASFIYIIHLKIKKDKEFVYY